MKNITNHFVTEYINTYYAPVNQALHQFRTIGEKNNVPIIQRETEQFLNSILALKEPKKILEIGSAIGYSATYFAAACPQAQVYTIEKNEQVFLEAEKNTKTYGYHDRIHCLLGDGEEQIKALAKQDIVDFDFVFLDAGKSHYRRFLDAAITVCAQDAIIISDNILQRGMTASDTFDTHDKHRTNIKQMRDYLEYICTDSQFSSSLYSIGDGVAMTIYRGKYE
ncbi:putative O-methyltransferase YrrM [Clostridiales Family XIII bacterium PM5-7]